ncbi:MAG: MG2 domain-containing protein, partial [Defluviitaleaceae bacterium]|nr:MG2 domain-containing protein [Defluviitaleaceae bacterium]
MTTKYASYILATIVVLISTHYVYHRASNFIIARRAEAAVHTQHQLSLVTNQVFYADTDLIATVQVLDMQGAPVKADLNVQGIGNDSGATYAFTTDYNGNGTITIPLEKVELDDMDWGWHTLHIEVQSALSTESFFKDINITQSGDTNHIIHFDKGIYAPGDDVLFRILALHSANAQPFAGGQYTISIFDGNDNRVYHENAQTSDFGIISGRFRLADEVNSGFYRLLVERDGFFQSEAFFEVFPYVLPRFEINLETDKTEYTVDEIIYVVGNARYFFDEPVNQGIVNVYINGLPELLDFPLDDNGEFTFSHIAHSPGLVRIWVEVIDNSNHRIEASLSVRVAEGPFEIELMPEHGYLVQDMPNTIYIFTSRADGSPTRAFLQITGPTFSRQVATDDNGMGMFILEDVREANLISVRAEDLEGNSIEREFFFDGLVRYATLSVNKPRFAMGETIYLSLNSLYPGGTFKIYAYQGDHLLQIITTDTDQAMLHLGDVFGLIDIYAMWMHPSHSFWRHIDLPFTSRTIFVDPGRSMQLSVQSDRPEYRPGEFVNLNIGVTDNSGVPLEAALLVNIVDEAVLSLAANDLSIDNIRLALDGIYFGNGLDAATLYASLIGEASEQTLTRLLLRRGDIEPAIQREWLINELPYAPDTSMSGGAMFLRIYLLLASAILFFALRHSQKNALKAAQSSGQMMRIDDETPTQTIERATVWTVIISVCLFAFALFFLTSCGNASDMAPSTEAPAPMADMAMEAPAAADDFDAAPAPARETPMLTEQAQTPAPAPVTQEDAADFEPVDEPADTAPVTEAEVETQTARVRRLFLETMLFVPELIARDGQANLDFMLADNITTWNIQV